MTKRSQPFSTGRWKAILVSGSVLLTAGLGLLGTLRYDTVYWHMAIFMALLGLGSAAQTTARNLDNRSAASTSVSCFLQNANRTKFRPSSFFE